MPDLANLTIRIDSRGVAVASRRLGRLGQEAVDAERSTGRLASALSSLRGPLAALAAGFGAAELGRMADAMTNAESKIRLVTGSEEELVSVQEELFRVAEETRSSYATSVTVFSRFTQALKSSGGTVEEVIRLTETLNKAFLISGATTQESTAALVQLGQALSSGVLRGEEFNSVSEQGSRVIQALADHLGVARDSLRDMAKDGKLTSGVLREALASQAGTIDTEFSKITTTIGQASTVSRDQFFRLVGGMDKLVGASGLVTDAIEWMGEKFKTAFDEVSSERAAAELEILKAETGLVSAKFARVGVALKSMFSDVIASSGRFSDFFGAWWSAEIESWAKGLDVILVEFPRVLGGVEAHLSSWVGKARIYGEQFANALAGGMSIPGTFDGALAAVDSQLDAALAKVEAEHTFALAEFKAEEARLAGLREAAANLAPSEPMRIVISKGSGGPDVADAAAGELDKFAESSARATTQQEDMRSALTASERAMNAFSDQVANAQLQEGLLGQKHDLLVQKLQAGEISFETYKTQLQSVGGEYADLAETVETWSDRAADAIADFATGSSTSLKDMVGSMLRDLARLAAKRAVTPLFDSILGGITGAIGGEGGITGAIGGLFGFGGARADGGPVQAGTPYVVGERGPELIVPRSSGVVIPNHAMGGQTVSVVVNVSADSSSVQSSDTQKEGLGRLLANQVRGVIIQEQRPGGLLTRGV